MKQLYAKPTPDSQESRSGSIPATSDFYICDRCDNSVPTVNKILHSIHCSSNRNISRPIVKTSQEFATDQLVSENKADICMSSDSSADIVASVVELPAVSALDGADDIATSPRWYCMKCSFENLVKHRYCNMCNQLNTDSIDALQTPFSNLNPVLQEPSQDTVAPSSSRPNRQWNCSDCTYSNAFASQCCGACGAVRPPDVPVRERLIDDDNDDGDNPNLHNKGNDKGIGFRIVDALVGILQGSVRVSHKSILLVATVSVLTRSIAPIIAPKAPFRHNLANDLFRSSDTSLISAAAVGIGYFVVSKMIVQFFSYEGDF